MKKIFYFTSILALAVLATSCEKFLTRDPQNKQTNDTFWQTETSLRTYAQGFYSSYFTGFGTDYSIFGGYGFGDDYTDDYLVYDSGGRVYFSTSAITDDNSVTSTWSDNYSIIYKANVMLQKIPDMNISESAKAHWTGIARYFRAMAYSAILRKHGGCPLIKDVVDPADFDNLYQDRASFLDVAKFVYEDYEYAVKNVRADDGKLQVNKYVVGAYMSRDLLFQATWLKYHGSNIGPTSQAVPATELKTLFEGAIDGAKAVMDSGKYKIGNSYNALFTTDDLAGNPEIIFYREYVYGVQCNSLISYFCKENQRGGVTNSAIESFVCADGLPICQSPLYTGGKYHEFTKGALENRDPRMYESFVVDSLRILGATGISYKEGRSASAWVSKKFLNEEWYATNSIYVSNTLQCPADGPTIRYAEVLLNYAEARYEVSKVGGAAFTQDDLDKSINQIHSRVLSKYNGPKKPATTFDPLPPLTLSGSNIAVNGVVINDTARDADVDPILWEIRRERRVELMLEGRRGDDLRRWAKYEKLNSEDAAGNPSQEFCGAYLNLDEAPFSTITGGIQLFDPETNTVSATNRKGYMVYGYKKGLRVFKKGELSSERYYLRAVPNAQITRYKDKGYTLTQNPGWE